MICFSARSALVLDAVPANTLRVMLTNELTAAAAVLRTLEADGAHTAHTTPAWVAANMQRWDELTGLSQQTAEPSTVRTDATTGPLLTSHWSQWRHYNSRHTEDPTPGFGYDGKVPAGCIPVAAAQFARSTLWPPYGEEGHVTVDDNTNNFVSGSFTSDFRHTFQWTNMLESYAFDQVEPPDAVAAVAQLTYDMAIAVDLDFGSFVSGGSIASLSSLGPALERYFFYDAGSLIQRQPDPALFDQQVCDELLTAAPSSRASPVMPL